MFANFAATASMNPYISGHLSLGLGNATYLFAARAMEWEEQELSELVGSVKAVGVMEPIVFAWLEIDGVRTKVYLDGRRRLLAANAASLADFEVQVPESEYKGELTEDAIGRFIDDVNSKAVELGRGSRKRTAGVIAKMETFLDKHRPAARARQIEAGARGAAHGVKGATHGVKGGRGKKAETPLGAPGRQGGFRDGSKTRAPKSAETAAKEAGTSTRTLERT